MNAPELNELLENRNARKVEYEEDSKTPNAGSFTIHLEDHTIGNLLRMQLLQLPETLFSGYKQPHPLENKIEIKLKTSNQSKPVDTLNKALNHLITKVDKLKLLFDKQLNEFAKNQAN